MRHRNPPEAEAAGSAENVDAQARDVRAHEEVRTVEDLLPSVARAGGPAPWKKKIPWSTGLGVLNTDPKNVTSEMIWGTESRPQRFEWKRKYHAPDFHLIR